MLSALLGEININCRKLQAIITYENFLFVHGWLIYGTIYQIQWLMPIRLILSEVVCTNTGLIKILYNFHSELTVTGGASIGMWCCKRPAPVYSHWMDWIDDKCSILWVSSSWWNLSWNWTNVGYIREDLFRWSHRHRIDKYPDTLLANQTARKVSQNDKMGQRKMGDCPGYY